MYNYSYIIETETGEQVEFTVTYRVTKFYPQTWESPEEPSEIEWIDEKVTKVYNNNGKELELTLGRKVRFSIYAKEYDELEYELWEDYYNKQQDLLEHKARINYEQKFY